MYNRVILVGNLTRDVELRYIPSGSAMAKIGIATNRRYKRQDGSNGEEVCFIDVTLFGRTAEIANQYLKKGSKILIEGRLVLENWVDQSGQRRSRHSVIADSMQMLGGGSSYSYDDSQIDTADASFNHVQNDYSPPPPKPNSSMQYNPPSQAKNSSNAQKAQQDTSEYKIPEINIDDDDLPF